MPRQPLVTSKQCEILLKLLQANPDFIIGLNPKTPYTHHKSNKFWEDAAALLNNIEGCKKTPVQWRHYWSDLKHTTKKKAIVRQSELETVDSSKLPYLPKRRPLTSHEIKILKMLGVPPPVKQKNEFAPTSLKVLAEGPRLSQTFLKATQDHTCIDLSADEVKVEEAVVMPEENPMHTDNESVVSNQEEETVDSMHEESVNSMHEESVDSMHEDSMDSISEKSVKSILKVIVGPMREESPETIREKSAEPKLDKSAGLRRNIRENSAGPMREMPAGAMKDKPVGLRRNKALGHMRENSAGPMREMPAGPMREDYTRPRQANSAGSMREKSERPKRGKSVNSQEDLLDTDYHSRPRMTYKTLYNRRPANPFLSAIDFEERRLRVDAQMAKALNRIAGALERIVKELD